MKKPELLLPAGDLEKLKIAFIYGADAVYVGGQKYGLRAKAKNFTYDELKEGVQFAHNLNKKVYVTLNIFAHNEDFEGLEEYLNELNSANIDAVIVSDLGVLNVVKETLPNMEIHISTQANTTNYNTVKMWQSLGAKRVVLARELSLSEIATIKEKTDVDLEAFVHGAMCMSYSGRCLLSNYMTNRDANRGACSQSCRWKYRLVEEKRPNEYMPVYEDERGTYIYNSKDLCMIQHIDKLSDIDSLKIEGRMKTAYYVATVAKAYREAIDDYFNDEQLYKSKLEYYMEEITKASYRDFSTGFYFNKPNGEDQVYTNNSYIRNYEFVALVLEEKEDYIIIEQRNKFLIEETLEVFSPNKKSFEIKIEHMETLEGEIVTEAPHPQQILKIKLNTKLDKFDILRKKTSPVK